jgi:hypothetical protein
MKKLLGLLGVFLISSCGYAPIDGSYNIIITRVEKHNNYLNNYYGMGNSDMVLTSASRDFKFRDSINKFTVGDTIRFVKK